MFTADLNPTRIRGFGEDEKQKLCRSLNMPRPFPSVSDFRQACSCNDCDSKTTKIVDFEAEIICLKGLANHHIFEFSDQHDLCLSLQSAAGWTKQMMNLLHKKLRALLSKDVYAQHIKTCDSTSKLQDLCWHLGELLVDGGFLPEIENNVSAALNDDDEDNLYHFDENYDVLNLIDIGRIHYGETEDRYYFGETEAKGKAALVLQKMADIEMLHRDDKTKFAETLPLSTSRKYIQQQIELVNTLPLDDLILKAKKVTDKRSPDRQFKLVEACNYIHNTCVEMRSKGVHFWEKHSRIRLKKFGLNDLDQPLIQDQIIVKQHNSNDVDQALDSLIDEVEIFRNGWEKEFAGLFTSYYHHSDTKRQKQTE